MLRFGKFIVKSLVYFAVFWFFFYHFVISGWNVDIGDTQGGREWLGREFKLKQPIFVSRYDDTGRYSASLPGLSCMVPASIEDYLADPENWQYTDSKAQRGWGRADGVIRGDWVHLVDAGTHVKINKIYFHRVPMSSDYLYIQVKIDDELIKKIPVDAYEFFNINYCERHDDGSYVILGFDEDVLEEIKA